MKRVCEITGESFEVRNEDRAFYKRVSPTFRGKRYDIPLSRLSPLERLRRRQAWRNERALSRRACDLCQKPTVSIYDSDAAFPVYCPGCWWSDAWSPQDFAQTFDFSKPFFTQFQELLVQVPRIALIHIIDVQNSEYTHDVCRLKNCYLIFDGEQSRDCCYGETFLGLQECFDFLDLHSSELCFECVACDQCYALHHSLNCFQCSDSWFLRDCRGCRDCFGCANLRGKQYYIFNEPHTKESYEEFIQKINTNSWEEMGSWRERAHAFWAKQPVRYMRGTQNEEVSGDFVFNSKNASRCFNSKGLRDCKFCTNITMGAKDCYDIDVWGNDIELCLDSTCIGENVRDTAFSLYVSQGAENVYYSQFCSRNVAHLFGCIGLRQSRYSVLNKPLSRGEYERLVPRIIGHMMETGEWGEFFPAAMSPFPYNHTVAHEFFPLSRIETQQRGLIWKEEFSQDSANFAKDTLLCAESGRAFRLQDIEKRFYEKMALPLPKLHPDIRHAHRMALRNPRHLYDRTCHECNLEVQTSYAPESPHRIMCDACYMKAVD